MSDQAKSGNAAELRRQAEVRLKQSPPKSELKAAELLHELQVHQIELEMQNDELRRTQAELDTVRARYFDLYDLAPVGYFTIDKSGLITEVNCAGATLLGVAKHPLIGQPFSRFIYSEDADHYYQYRTQITAAHFGTLPPPACADLRMMKQADLLFWAQVHATSTTDATGAPVVCLTVTDITVSKLAAERVLYEKNEWARTFDAVPDLISIIDRNHTILRANRAFADKLGVTTNEAVGLKCYECVHGLEGAPDFCPHTKLLADQQQHGCEVFEHRFGGHFFVTCTPVRDTDGSLLGSVHVARDITASKQAEQELKEMQAQVVQDENLRVLGQMAAGVAHDFNNALSPIIGFSELLLQHPEKLADHALVRKYLQHINTSGTDAAHTVRQMCEFGHRHGTGTDYRSVDLHQLIRQAIEHTQQRWKDQAQAEGRTIHLVTELRPVPSVAGEEFAIREVLTNLIFNAVDALPEGGTITLGAQLEDEFVQLWVRDTGSGMTKEVRRRCLEPFFTTKRPLGTGLGLSMVQGIVQRHGGTVEIESEVGQGTTVMIRLPIQTEESLPAIPSSAATVSRSLRVLVVDDEPLLCAVAEAWLLADHHKVVTAENGAEALAQLAAGLFDLVITDKAMPEMNGEQLAAAISKAIPNLPVILMTGFGDLMKATGEKPPHIRTILSKPLTQTSLRAALTAVFPPQ